MHLFTECICRVLETKDAKCKCKEDILGVCGEGRILETFRAGTSVGAAEART